MADFTLPGGPANRLLTAAEVSEMQRVPRSTVYELTRSRRIPFLKVGRRTLFDPDVLRVWVVEQTIRPRGESGRR
jgi:excisionase family DNA binding protein